jgi:hypothetical protein
VSSFAFLKETSSESAIFLARILWRLVSSERSCVDWREVLHDGVAGGGARGGGGSELPRDEGPKDDDRHNGSCGTQLGITIGCV